MGGFGSGGRNKTHATVEDYNRIDSFAFYSHLMGDEYIRYKDTVNYPSAISPDIVVHVQERTMEIQTGTHYSPLRLSKVPGINGQGIRVYFECPHCGRRCRYLYKKQGDSMCRKCLGANYQIQQRRGMRKLILQMKKIVETDLDYTHWRMDNPGSGIQDLYRIPKPPYMRYERYAELVTEYRRLQDQHTALTLKACYAYLPPEVAAVFSKYR